MAKRESFCYNCGHSLLSHATYSFPKGHLVYDFEPYTFKHNWLGIPVTVGIHVPKLVSICRCIRFISKKEIEIEEDG